MPGTSKRHCDVAVSESRSSILRKSKRESGGNLKEEESEGGN